MMSPTHMVASIAEEGVIWLSSASSEVGMKNQTLYPGMANLTV